MCEMEQADNTGLRRSSTLKYFAGIDPAVRFEKEREHVPT
jgi:hypothetical protein